MLRFCLSLWCVLVVGCDLGSTETPADGKGLSGSSVEPGTDGDDSGGGGGGDDTSVQESYDGPDYQACISDAECEPGSACVAVSGHANTYCAPACDPGGDGSECIPEGSDLSAVCLPSGRCAQTCAADAVAEEGTDGTLIPAATDLCPDDLACMTVSDQETPLCAGPRGGQAGPYGTCSHPNLDGPDCPEQTSCFGGTYIGLEDAGVCLPWCDDGICPPLPDGVTAAPICYDVGLDHPMCALLCTPGDSICPSGQSCYDLGFVGLCAPDGAEINY